MLSCTSSGNSAETKIRKQGNSIKRFFLQILINPLLGASQKHNFLKICIVTSSKNSHESSLGAKGQEKGCVWPCEKASLPQFRAGGSRLCFQTGIFWCGSKIDLTAVCWVTSFSNAHQLALWLEAKQSGPGGYDVDMDPRRDLDALSWRRRFAEFQGSRRFCEISQSAACARGEKEKWAVGRGWSALFCSQSADC